MKVLLGIFILFVSCSETRSLDDISKQNCYKKLNVEVKDNWKYRKDSLFYKTNPIFIKKLTTDYKDCILSMSQEHVTGMFGSPTEIEKWPTQGINSVSLRYLINPPCKGRVMNEVDFCTYFIFILDKKNKVREISSEESRVGINK